MLLAWSDFDLMSMVYWTLPDKVRLYILPERAGDDGFDVGTFIVCC